MRDEPRVGTPERQRTTLAAIADVISHRDWLDALVVVGSLADDTADAVSDIDLLVVVREGRFDSAWQERADLHVTGALCSWDQAAPDSPLIAAHRWLTDDVVLVEALFGTASSGLRLAEPWSLVAGDAAAPSRLTPRPAVTRGEMGQGGRHPVEAAYDDFKSRLRHGLR